MRARRSIWFTLDQINTLSKIVANAIERNSTEVDLLGVHDEIAVAQQRSRTSRVPLSSLSTALGRPEAGIPLKLSVEEITTLISLSGIDQTIKNELVKSL